MISTPALNLLDSDMSRTLALFTVIESFTSAEQPFGNRQLKVRDIQQN
jgi:hypothetical protein